MPKSPFIDMVDAISEIRKDLRRLEVRTLSNAVPTVPPGDPDPPGGEPSVDTPSTITPDATGSAGTSTQLSRGDHVHGIAAAAPSTNLSHDSVNTEGIGTSFARADHIHAIENLSAVTDATSTLLSSDANGYLQLVRLGTGIAPEVPLHSSAATEQLRLEYNAANKASFTVDSGGGLALSTVTDAAGGNLALNPAGDVTFNPTGNDCYPFVNYDLNLGLLNKKWLTIHAAELWVETLVAQDTIATIGGRVIVAPTTTLTQDLYGNTIAGNTDFETAGAGGADVFGTWTENASDGAIAQTNTAGEVYYLTYAAKLTAGAGVDTYIYQDITVKENCTYAFYFYTRGDGTYAGRYRVYDNTNAADITALTSTGVTGTTYTLITANFTAPASCTSARIYLYCPSTDTGYACFDRVLIWDKSIFVKHNQMQSGDMALMQANGKIEFMSVTSAYTKVGDAYRYTVSRSQDGTGANDWYAGDAVVNTGTTGSGFIDLYSLEGILGRPVHYIYNYDYAGGSEVYSSNYAGDPNFTLFADNANTEVNDSVFFGVEGTAWENIYFYLGTAAVYSGTITWKYWNGSAWTTFVPDTTTDFKTAGFVEVEWTAGDLTGWASRRLNTIDAFWIRAQITSFTSWTTNPVVAGRKVYYQKNQWGPTIAGMVRESATFNDIIERWAIGNLNGMYGYSTELYGFAAGKYSTDTSWLSADETNGIRIMKGSTQLANWDISGNILIGQESASQENIYISSGALKLRRHNGSANVDKIVLEADGDIFVGGNVSSPSSTHLVIFNTTHADYNGHAYAASDMIIGSTDSGKANMFWDESAGKFEFRSGVSDPSAYIASTGEVMAGSGKSFIDSTGFAIRLASSQAKSTSAAFRFLEASPSTDLVGGLYGYYQTSDTYDFNKLELEAVSTGYARLDLLATAGASYKSAIHVKSTGNYTTEYICGYDLTSTYPCHQFTSGGVKIGNTTGTINDGELWVSNDTWIGGSTDILGSLNVGTNTASSFMTTGITIRQGAADDEIIAMASTDVAHPFTSLTGTSTYGTLSKDSATAGGLKIVGYRDSNDTAGRAVSILGRLGEAADTTKSTDALGVVTIVAQITDGSDSVTYPSTDQNLMVIRSHSVTRFIFDAEGDSHQDTGTSWTNFDQEDDIALLNLVSAHVTRPDDPLKEKFRTWLDESRDQLEKLKLVTFNSDGHHFVNWSRMSMLQIGAIRQLAERLDRLEKMMGVVQ